MALIRLMTYSVLLGQYKKRALRKSMEKVWKKYGKRDSSEFYIS
jgi:hypothetical protein